VLSCAVGAKLGTKVHTYTIVDWKLPDTGQTKCYSATGAVIGCKGTGQDGAYSSNPLSYVNNGNGTVTDKVTGLMWQQQDDNTRYNGYQATGEYNDVYNPSTDDVCASLELGGYADWRLPTIGELTLLINRMPGSSPTDALFTGAKQDCYWSSTDQSGALFNVNLSSVNTSTVTAVDESNSCYVRCVRGTVADESYSDNGNGTVTDNLTHLVWQQEDDNTVRTLAQALTYCESLPLAGNSTWRLPNVNELQSIVDFDGSDILIDPLFLNAKADAYWTSTTGGVATTGIYVDFAGEVNSYGKDSFFYVRCVRSGP